MSRSAADRMYCMNKSLFSIILPTFYVLTQYSLVPIVYPLHVAPSAIDSAISLLRLRVCVYEDLCLSCDIEGFCPIHVFLFLHPASKCCICMLIYD